MTFKEDYITPLLDFTKEIPVKKVAFFLAVLIALKVVFDFLHSVNSVPVLNYFLEFLGLIQAVWFTSKFLVKANDRAELMKKIMELKEVVL